MSITEIDFKERYDRLLDIKTYEYEREIPEVVPFNYVGLEIELAVHYTRDRYSFIRTLLKNVKNTVGEDGFFTVDGTILGDYGFEITLDPLPVSKAIKIYKNIMRIVDFSDGSIRFDKESQCGLHLNFNQFDVENIHEAHQRLLLLIDRKKEFFEENIFKRIESEADFNDYLEFQKTVADKYTGVNYLNKKLVEIRNIRTGLSASQLEIIIKDIEKALYYERIVEGGAEIDTISSDKVMPEEFDLYSEVMQDEVGQGILEHRSLELDSRIAKTQCKYNESLIEIGSILNIDVNTLTIEQKENVLAILGYNTEVEKTINENNKVKKVLERHRKCPS